MEWDKLKVFYTVAQEGSFNKAAKRLNVAQSSIGRSISILEHSLKTKLFIRNARGVVLTEDGETLFHHVRNMIIEAENAKTAIQQKKDEVSGEITIVSTYGFASTSLCPYITQFAKLYPNVRISLICNDEGLDLRTREADISIGNFDITGESSLIQTFLTTRAQHLYASNEYLRKRGIPKTVEDLAHHSVISFNNPYRPIPYKEPEWILRVGLKPHEQLRKPCFVTNSVESLYKAAVDGLGIIALSNDSVLLKNMQLFPILTHLESDATTIYFTYTSSLKTVKLVRVLERFLINCYIEKNEIKA